MESVLQPKPDIVEACRRCKTLPYQDDYREEYVPLLQSKLKSLSKPISREKLLEVNRYPIRTLEQNEMMEYYFKNKKYVNVTIIVYKDGTQWIKCNRSVSVESSKHIPIVVSMNYNGHDTFQDYKRSIDEYYATGKDDMDLYFIKSKYQPGHAFVALWDKNAHTYDIFDCSHSFSGRERTELALNHFFGIRESKKSRSFISDLSPVSSLSFSLQDESTVDILQEKNMMCVLYYIAYLICRSVCDHHSTIILWFRECHLKNPSEFLHLIGGLFIY
jgi:hypothetical protein